MRELYHFILYTVYTKISRVYRTWNVGLGAQGHAGGARRSVSPRSRLNSPCKGLYVPRGCLPVIFNPFIFAKLITIPFITPDADGVRIRRCVGTPLRTTLPVRS